jgi:hypothetical protein
MMEGVLLTKLIIKFPVRAIICKAALGVSSIYVVCGVGEQSDSAMAVSTESDDINHVLPNLPS